MKKRYICLILCVGIMLSLLSGCSKKNGEAEPEPTPTPTPHPVYALTDAAVNKEEAVYINLSPAGEVKAVSVTDRLHTDMPQVRIADKSTLKDIQDIKNYNSPVYEDGNMYWDMDSTDLYYSGTTDAKPPISIAISYKLDGEDIEPSKLAGKSGKIEINIKAENTLKQNMSGYEISCPMLFFGGMLLPNESFSDVAAPEGTVLSDGSRSVVFFAGIPGMSASLGLDTLGVPMISSLGAEEFTVTADAEKFALGNMMFVAVPLSSITELGPDSLKDGTDDMKTMLADIQSLMGAFNSLSLNDMVQMLYGDAQQIESLISSVGRAAALYKENKALIDVLNKYINEGNLQKLETLLNDMQQIDTDRLRSLSEYTHFNELINLLGVFDSNIAALAQFSRDWLDMAPTFEALQADLSSPEVQQSLNNLPQIISELQSLVDALHQSQAMLERMSGVLSSESLNKIIDFTKQLEGSESMKTLTEAERNDLTARAQSWIDFGRGYDIFTARTDKMTSTVMFVYKTEAI